MINKYSILNGAKYFSPDRLQNYLVFILTRCIYWISNDNYIIKLWGSTGMSQESVKNPHTLDINFAPKLIGEYQSNCRARFKRICSKQDCVFSS